MITDASGAVVKTFATNAFGVRNKAAETGTFELPLGFAGGIEDPVTGLVRFGLRDYEPATGRLTARDPILHEGGMNLYVYSGNDPVAKRDPSGMDEGGGVAADAPDAPAERIVGHFNKLVEWVNSEDGREAIETVAEIPAEDNAIVKGASRLKKGLDAPSSSPRTRGGLRGRAGEPRCPSRPWPGSSAARVHRRRAGRSRHAGGVVEEALDAVLPHARRRARRGHSQLRRAAPARSDRNGTGEPVMMRRIALSRWPPSRRSARGTAAAADITYTGATAPGPRRPTGTWAGSRRPATW